MNTVGTVESPRSFPSLRVMTLGALLLGVFLLALDYVLSYTPRYLLREPDAFAGMTPLHSVVLVVHLCVGIGALLVGPLQLFTGARRRGLTFHRWLGRGYACAISVGGVAAAGMLILTGGSLNFRLGIAGLDVAWLGSTGLAYLAIRKGQVKLHREWMVRSYVATFGFVFFRIILEVLSARHMGTRIEIQAVASWACWSIPLLVVELVMEGRKVLAVRSIVAPDRKGRAPGVPERGPQRLVPQQSN